MRVWVHSVPPNVLGVYSSEEKSEEAKQEMDDDLYTRLDVWIWEVDGEEVEEE